MTRSGEEQTGWRPDPFGRHEWRWFDQVWTDRVMTYGIEVVDPLAAHPEASSSVFSSPASAPIAADPARTVPVPARPDHSDTISLPRAAASSAGSWLIEMLVWLVPVVVLGGVGLMLVPATSDSGTVDPADESRMWTAMIFLSLATACFFGRGTLKALGRTFSGRGGIGDALFAHTHIMSLLITLAAIGVAVLSAVMAVSG